MAMSKTDKLSHYAIVFIAVMAVVVSIWQVRISQEHNKLSVKPFMDSFTGWVSAEEWMITLTNEGVGPAIIVGIDYNVNGKTYKNWDSVFEAMELERSRRTASYNFDYPSPFATEKKINFLGLKLTEEEYRGTLKGNMGVEAIIYYESIYKEPFKSVITF